MQSWDVDRMKETDVQKLQDEYSKLVEGLGRDNDGAEDDMLANPGTGCRPASTRL